MATIIDIAGAVVTALNGAGEGTFSQPFTAARRVLPEFDLADLAAVHVTVAPKGVTVTATTRGLSQHDVQVDIGVQKRVGADMDGDVAALCGLTEKIASFLKGKAMAGAAWARTANEPVYSADHLAEKRLFTSVLTVTYRLMR